MNVFATHGAFSWCELMTNDPQAAMAFYGKLFGWSFETSAGGQGPYQVIKAKDAPVGGIMRMPQSAPGRPKPTASPRGAANEASMGACDASGMPPMWGCYVTVDDVDATAEQCKVLGGSVVMPPTDIPTVGRFAVLRDPQGAVLTAITYLRR
jgi:predicted enzyme related to lactoylglutathione lyase